MTGPCAFVIFGAVGHLATTKLLPALYHLEAAERLGDALGIVAFARRDWDTERWRSHLHAVLAEHAADPLDADVLERFARRFEYVRGDYRDEGAYARLLEAVSRPRPGACESMVFYLAVPPGDFMPVVAHLDRAGLNSVLGQHRIVVEKPFGTDLASARELNAELSRHYREEQIYRIDHYLGKETVQNLLALRFANSLFEPLWSRASVDHVQITVAEDLGVGGRIEFYDKIGALRDMVQNHIVQLICLIAMEPPTSLHHDAVRDEKIKVLRAMRPMDADAVRLNTVRGQYDAGAINGESVPGYAEELNGEKSSTETFVAIKLEIDNWRWSNVPFYLRTGKRLKEKHSEIVVEFKDVPHSIFPEQKYNVQPNRLTIRLQPDEGVKLSLMAKEPGPGGFDLRPVSLDLSFEETFGICYPDAYERLLMEVLRGNPALFMRRDEVEAAWKWVDSIIAGWNASGQKVETYVAGSWGPTASSVLLDRDGRAWHPDT